MISHSNFTLAPSWMLGAARKLGLQGSANSANNIPTQQVQEFLKAVHAPLLTTEKDGSTHVTHWCAAFANACLKEAGIAGTNSAAANSFLHWGSPLTEPRFGTICVLKRKGGNHVAFFVDTFPDGALLLLGGNQGHMVRFGKFTKIHLHTNGYRWPSFLHKGMPQDSALGLGGGLMSV